MTDESGALPLSSPRSTESPLRQKHSLQTNKLQADNVSIVNSGQKIDKLILMSLV